MEKGINYPLVIDLDGSLIKNDTIIEAIIKSINQNFLNIFKILYFFFQKKN